MANIFLSYTHIKNRWGDIDEWQNRLENYVQQKVGDAGLRIFIDTKGLRAGEKWDASLETAITEAQLFVVLLSPSWINSCYCRKEYKTFKAANPGSPVLPILWDRVHADDIKSDEGREIFQQLNEIQRIDWLDLQYESWKESEPKRVVAKIAEEIRALLKRRSLANG
jgi:TIR domain